MITENISALISDTFKSAQQLLPEDAQKLRASIEQIVRERLELRLKDMNLVSKDEFQAHHQLLSRLKERVLELEARIEALEKEQNSWL